MLNRLSPIARSSLFLAVTALVVSYVRTFLQYHRYSWESIGEFFTFWIIHYIGVGAIAAISHTLLSTRAKFFFGSEKENHKIAYEETIVYTSVVLIVTAITIFIVAHWIPSPDE